MTRALVLRAREDAARTAAKLRELGYEPLLSPVLEIAATGEPIPAGAYDAVLASSAKGLECAGAEAQPYKSLPFHAVGAKTAAAAQSQGWRPEIVAGNAEAILPLLLDHYGAPAHFLYLAGRDRQAALEAGLRAGGHAITAAEVYEARAAERLSDEAVASMREGAVDIALHYSRRSAEIFLALAEAAGLTPHLSRMAHVALSEEVAKPLRAIGLNPAVAAKPDEAGLLAAARNALEGALLRDT
ncbi:uroporphyrinogen-III synthase [Methylocystis sp. IM3]|uniref:uroporphyrinogen-III synthase n=1 Tax=unclassified Methylocystis TaxID=2625913 RepID=UPI0030FC55AC